MKYITLILSIFSLSTALGQTKITNKQAQEDLVKNKNIQLLDVRTPKEYNEKHIANAIHIDWKDQSSFEAYLSKLDKTNPVYIYCLGGGRSAQAAKKLHELGYEVYDVEGGILKWEAANLPLIHGEDKKMSADEYSLDDFNDIIKNNDQVLVDFYASWCAPCQELMPTINVIEEKYKTKLKVLKIDVDKNKELIKTLGVSSIPTLHLYKNNTKVWSSSSVTSQKIIEKQINKK